MGSAENLCKKNNCDLCCRDTPLGMRAPNFALFKTALCGKGCEPEEHTHETFQTLSALTGISQVQLVIYRDGVPEKREADVVVQMFGACHFLIEGECELMLHPDVRPHGCATDIQPADWKCTIIRSRFGLSPIEL